VLPVLTDEGHPAVLKVGTRHPETEHDLTDVWDVEACEIVAGFYPRLHKPAPPQLTPLSSYVAGHVERLDGLPRTPPCRGGWSSTRCGSSRNRVPAVSG
jgi:streptomycin 6-kinase